MPFSTEQKADDMFVDPEKNDGQATSSVQEKPRIKIIQSDTKVNIVEISVDEMQIDAWDIVSTVNCNTAKTAAQEMADANAKYAKNTENKCYVINQLLPGEVANNTANDIGREFALQQFPYQQAVVCTSLLETGEIRNAIIVNALIMNQGGHLMRRGEYMRRSTISTLQRVSKIHNIEMAQTPDQIQREKDPHSLESLWKQDCVILHTSAESPQGYRALLDMSAVHPELQAKNMIEMYAQCSRDFSVLHTEKDWAKLGGRIRRQATPVYLTQTETTTEAGVSKTTEVAVPFYPVEQIDLLDAAGNNQFAAPEKPSLSGMDKLKGLLATSPVPVVICNGLPEEGHNAFFFPDQQQIKIRRGMSADDCFRALSQEITHAKLAEQQGSAYLRRDAAFDAYCTSYTLCRRFDVDTSSYAFDSVLRELEGIPEVKLMSRFAQIHDAAISTTKDMQIALGLDVVQQDARILNPSKTQQITSATPEKGHPNKGSVEIAD